MHNKVIDAEILGKDVRLNVEYELVRGQPGINREVIIKSIELTDKFGTILEYPKWLDLQMQSFALDYYSFDGD